MHQLLSRCRRLRPSLTTMRPSQLLLALGVTSLVDAHTHSADTELEIRDFKRDLSLSLQETSPRSLETRNIIDDLVNDLAKIGNVVTCVACEVRYHALTPPIPLTSTGYLHCSQNSLSSRRHNLPRRLPSSLRSSRTLRTSPTFCVNSSNNLRPAHKSRTYVLVPLVLKDQSSRKYCVIWSLAAMACSSSATLY